MPEALRGLRGRPGRLFFLPSFLPGGLVPREALEPHQEGGKPCGQARLLGGFKSELQGLSVGPQSRPTLRPHGLQPTRPLRPWDSPGKNTGVGCHFLLQCMQVKSESEVTQSCLILGDPMDCSPPGSSIHGIFQARVLEWGAIAFSHSTIYK